MSLEQPLLKPEAPQGPKPVSRLNLCGLCHTTPQEYSYKPLVNASHQIRVLRPERARSKHWLQSRTLRFTVQTITLNLNEPSPYYYAISYAWGENTRLCKIYLDGAPLMIPHGAEEALRGVLNYLRSSKENLLPLWIDAVCINQKGDTEEKSRQVGIMGDIYRNAECVFIWLGPEDRNAKAAMRACQDLRDECRHWTNEGQNFESNRSLPPKERYALPYMRLPPPKGCRIQSFYSLLTNRWFSRLWIVQEVVLSKRAMLLRGRQRLAWDIFALAIQWCRHRLALWCTDIITAEEQASLFRVNKIISLRQDRDERTMEALLQQAFNFQTTDPLDKVYGLLGMVNDSDHGPNNKTKAPPSMDFIVPNYNKSLVEVYAQATWVAMKSEKSLELLSPACTTSIERDGTRVDETWPSWVPYFDRKPDISKEAVGVYNTNAHNDFEAILTLHPTMPFALQAHGVSLGVIERVRLAPGTITETNPYSGHDLLARYFSYLWDPAYVHEKGTTWSMGLIQKFASALVCGSYGDNHSTPHRDADALPSTVPDFAGFMLAMKEHCPDLPANAPLQELLEQHCHDPPSLPPNPPLEALLEKHGSRVSGVSNYATTVKTIATEFAHIELPGSRFGVGYQDCIEGEDEVCVLFGAKTPYVLRKSGEFWRLRGPVYVAGVMKGEYIQHLEDTGCLEAEDRVYEIR